MTQVVGDDCNRQLVLLKCMWVSSDCKQMCTHPLPTVPLVSNNPINGGNEEKYERNGKDRRKRGRERTNLKKRGRLGDGWDCCLLAIIVSL